jgi:branched-chain amino acid transport system permease protein
MMRAIRDNEVVLGRRHGQGRDRAGTCRSSSSALPSCGIAGAMMTTLDGQLTHPAEYYQPLRFTFLIWVMVIVGGSGNNWGAVLGGHADLAGFG